MKCIVPLAGPELWGEEGFRPMKDIGGAALLVRSLKNRPWYGSLKSEDFIFVIREVGNLNKLIEFLEREWPGHRRVTLSKLTNGAMLSALAGCSSIPSNEEVIIDLGDVLFSQIDGDLESLFASSPAPAMIVPVFESTDPSFSYLRLEGRNIVGAAEKKVVSNSASAGVYAFKDIGYYLQSAAWCLSNSGVVTYGGAHYICPMVNGILGIGGKVAMLKVKDPDPVSKIFHRDDR